MSNEFADMARDCLRRAEATKDEFVRGQLIAMAQHWMGVAMEEEDNQAATTVPER
jgi:hypothetical protein